MKANNEIRLLNAVSDISRRVDQVQRTRTQSAFFYGTHNTSIYLFANTVTVLYFLEPIKNQGIILNINSADTGAFTIMSTGNYLITVNVWCNPAVADVQLHVYVRKAGTIGFIPTQQVNFAGASVRTAMTATTQQYFEEGDCMYLFAIASAQTEFTNRTEHITDFKSPYITITQLTGGYETTNDPNEWYGDGKEDL